MKEDKELNDFYRPPLSVCFVWHPYDFEIVKPILDIVRNSFARDKNKPFSRGLNIPLFFFTTSDANAPPNDISKNQSNISIVFVFTSVNTTGHDNWRDYIDNLKSSDGLIVLPIAIDRDGLNHGGAIKGVNFIRSFEWPKEHNEFYAIVFLAHEVFRYGFQKIEKNHTGKNSSITIFLSHAKTGGTGRLHSEEIKKFIDNTNMNRFFDSNEISSGFQFGEEIEKSILQSTLIAIVSDSYSSRYWCQREVLYAKSENRPVIVVNSLHEYEDRIFPAASNVPCVHVPSDTPISERDILRILSSAILETIRHAHSIKCLKYYKKNQWIPESCIISSRPPEIRQALKEISMTTERLEICYPEPPIYSEEAEWHKSLGMESYTPLWRDDEKNMLNEERIGLSISSDNSSFPYSHHIHSDSLVRLSQDLSRHLLARSATLIYGGDLRPNGFTEFILNEALILKERIPDSITKIENYLAWPIHLATPEIVSWRSKYNKVMNTICCAPPDDVESLVNKSVAISPDTLSNSYIWSRCLTNMREKSVDSSTIRIFAGGKRSGYQGKMPGVLEEFLISIKQQKPIYLLGAFGGVVGDICSFLRKSDLPPPLTEKWQRSYNNGYLELQEYAKDRNHSANYENIADVLSGCSLSDLSTLAGLSESEYIRIMKSPFIDECIHLIIVGIKNLQDK